MSTSGKRMEFPNTPKALGPRAQWVLRQQGRRPDDYSHKVLSYPAVMPGKTPASFVNEVGAVRKAEQEARDAEDAHSDVRNTQLNRRVEAFDQHQTALAQARRTVYEQQIEREKSEAAERKEEEKRRDVALRKACLDDFPRAQEKGRAEALRIACLESMPSTRTQNKLCQQKLFFLGGESVPGGSSALKQPQSRQSQKGDRNHQNSIMNLEGPAVNRILNMGNNTIKELHAPPMSRTMKVLSSALHNDTDHNCNDVAESVAPHRDIDLESTSEIVWLASTPPCPTSPHQKFQSLLRS